MSFTNALRRAELESLWAKSSDVGGLPLPRHLLDVAAVAIEVVARLPARSRIGLCTALSLDVESGTRWIAASVGLHDLGKATPGFQAKWAQGCERAARAGFPFPVGAPDRHDAATSGLLPGHLRRKAANLDRSTTMLLVDAVSAHHGYRVPQVEAQAFSPIDAPAPAPWVAAQAQLVDLVFDVLQPIGTPRIEPDERSSVWQLIAGLCSFSDWVGSSDKFFTHDRPKGDYLEWYAQSRMLAAAALDQVGWLSSPARRDRVVVSSSISPLDVALPKGISPRPLQRAIAKLLADVDGPVLVLIEAPMGEGKTEAAFAGYAALEAVADHRGLYVAMPTQATSNAIYGRVAAYLGRLHRQDVETLQLVHGGARLEDARLRLRDVGFGPDDASVHASAWFSGSKRALLAPNAVGTVDQALIAVLNARHAFVRMFGLAGRFVILDEVHAYDDYTGGLLEHLVGWLGKLGCSVIVMSATLPTAKRDGLARAWWPDAKLPELDYPRICVVAPGRVEGLTFPASRRQQVKIRGAHEQVVELARLAASLVSAGGCALVVANTVKRAQEIYAALAQYPGLERLLFHARYPFEERLAREREVVGRFGVAGQNRDRTVLVATQVVEQSLDIDFDVCISDLAPVDLLFQRIGRLHRHARPRPAHLRRATLYVAGLGDTGVPPLDPRRVYDEWPVFRTAAILRSLQTIDLPTDIDRLVQQVYGGQSIVTSDADLEAAIQTASGLYDQMKARQLELAAQAALPMPDDWIGWTLARPIDDAAAETAGPAGGTRLGQPSLQIVPVFDLVDRWSVDPAGTLAWPKTVPVPEQARLRLADRYIRLARHWVADVTLAKPLPRGWSGSPLTEPFVPVLFDVFGVVVGQGARLVLDVELGLCIERLSP
jgi:CRISPR-associated endonuclease/helicase Cas3